MARSSKCKPAQRDEAEATNALPGTYPRDWKLSEELAFLRAENAWLRDTIEQVREVLGAIEPGEQLVMVARYAALADGELASIDAALSTGVDVPRPKLSIH